MIPARYAHFIFSLILSGIMSFLVSGIATYRATGMVEDFTTLWVASWVSSWMLSYPSVLIVAPFARRVTNLLVRQPAAQ
ncbi:MULTISPECIES: DUF2798 domain-containing protein [unclassified Thioclava]|uniref:DUF2798 domain-containing protein n=1 Tax=unclassified Thioclava TaxID=2621713 RepID=UPI0009987513|nr:MULTISPECIES: DUF2798 domain-containing protein [unclassified Thioclava]MPQ92417.1 DUF2798 domain-containing protein [Thioclava sp. JE_KL1]OOY32983.1 hypothetical protein BMI88_03710 [Thioclava sp. F36-6]